MKKKGYNGHTGLWREKPSKKLGGKRQKICCGALLSRREREREVWKLLKKVSWISQDLILKKTYSRFSIDRKSVSIDRNRQKLTKIFKCNFDWSKNRLDQSKFWKNRIFEKINQFLKKLLKALNIRNKMHKYEIKCFSKTWVLNLVFQKLRFSNILPLNSQTQNMFCIRTQSICKLGWSDRKTHIITCTIFSKE